MVEIYSTAPKPRPCALYLAGHTVHWIQGIRSGNAKRDTPLPRGEVLSLDGDLIVIGTDEGLVRYRNHDLNRLKSLLETCGDTVEIDEHWSLITVPNARGRYCISIAKDKGIPLEPCVDPRTVKQPDSVEALADQIAKYGGATLHVDQIRRDAE